MNAHGTSTIYNDRAEAQALTALFAGASPPVTAVKGTTGHMIAGSGAVEAVVALASVAKCAGATGLRPAHPRPRHQPRRRPGDSPHGAGPARPSRTRSASAAPTRRWSSAPPRRPPAQGHRTTSSPRHLVTRHRATVGTELNRLKRTGALASFQYSRSGPSRSSWSPRWRTSTWARADIIPQATAYPWARISR